MTKHQMTGCQFSPTYLSTNLLSPLRSPFRDTVPMTNIISGGTFSNRKREDWGAFDSDYGGIGKYSIYKDCTRTRRQLDVSRSHRHYISGLSKVIHDVVQPSVVTSLLRSNCRQNDQFIGPPHIVNNVEMMREENKFVQEPSYSSHICRTAMFPLSEIEEYKVLQFPERISPTPPLGEKTNKALSNVIKNRYKVTSYEKDFEQQDTEESQRSEQLQRRKPKTKFEEKSTRNNGPPSLKIIAQRALVGLWPCWPAGSCCIVSTVTGQIVEKRDVVSLDDLRDARLQRKNISQLATENLLKDEDMNSATRENIETNSVEENSDVGFGDDVDEVQGNLVKTKKSEINARRYKYAKKWLRDCRKRTCHKCIQQSTETDQPQLCKPILNPDDLTTAILEKIRKEDTLYLLLKSLMKGSQDNEPETTSPALNSHLYRVERRDHTVLLPPEPLYKTLAYSGNRIADRLGVRYKTVAMKRYHKIHPETVPDLRDFRPPVRKCKFLGYHTSTFR